MAKWLDATIVDKVQWTDRHYSLRFEAPSLDFKAGQFVRVGMEIDGDIVARPYSLVNAPDEKHLEIFFNIVPEGPLTPPLADTAPGDMVKLSAAANGFLVVDEIPAARHLWLLATGTGVGPFISILKTGQPWQRFDKIILAYSVRTGDELAYQDDLRALEQQYPQQFRYLPVVTREICAGCINQRITTALQSGELEEFAGEAITPEDSHVMMCGNSEMIVHATEELGKRGLKKHRRREPGHITTEKYH